MKVYWAYRSKADGLWTMGEKTESVVYPESADAGMGALDLGSNREKAMETLAKENAKLVEQKRLENRANEDLDERVEFFVESLQEDLKKAKADFLKSFDKDPSYSLRWHALTVSRAAWMVEQTAVILTPNADVSKVTLLKRVYSRVKGMLLCPHVPHSSCPIQNAVETDYLEAAAKLARSLQGFIEASDRRDEARKKLGLEPIPGEPFEEPLIY